MDAEKVNTVGSQGPYIKSRSMGKVKVNIQGQGQWARSRAMGKVKEGIIFRRGFQFGDGE